MTDAFIPKHGGYKTLLSYQKAEIVFDGTVFFCNRFIDPRSRTHDQMVPTGGSSASCGPWNRPSSRKAACTSA